MMAETVPGHSFTLKQSTAFVRTFFFGTTGDTVTVNISKAGGGGIPGSFVAPSGGATATAIASGWYYIGLSGTDTNGAGVLAYHCSGAPSGNTCDFADLIQTTIITDLMIDGTGRVYVVTNLKQNAPIAAFQFNMTLTGQPKPGLVGNMTIQRALGSGGFSPISSPSSIVDIGGGSYTVALSATDLNAPTVTLMITSPMADTAFINIITNP
jgi:hypothetical protein